MELIRTFNLNKYGIHLFFFIFGQTVIWVMDFIIYYKTNYRIPFILKLPFEVVILIVYPWIAIEMNLTEPLESILSKELFIFLLHSILLCIVIQKRNCTGTCPIRFHLIPDNCIYSELRYVYNNLCKRRISWSRFGCICKHSFIHSSFDSFT
ncbi:hypothetical protein SAMN05444362_11221 [Dysgonomonas macrotermitis]|uniref:Uncharacterized protein n=1 Tax=Dysgonomonas macrotermitis TaxID=1346286 RepID=A0A1M5FJZ9_9BACT|nr:hypothetical protein SAMN05444362_11221 [Dysgonomonas macrotermitis]